MSHELLNCPVCGSQPRVSRVHNEVVVNCDCSFEYQLESMVDDDETADQLLQARFTRQSAIEQWNLSVLYYQYTIDFEATA